MSQNVKLEVFYPYPPERVWQVLTDRRALAIWMMDNDFEPKLGHKFRFYSQSSPGATTIQCEVLELEEPNRLVYTWQDSPTCEPSLVIWTLTAVTGGTQLQLKHQEYSYTVAIAKPASYRITLDTSMLKSENVPSFDCKLSSNAFDATRSFLLPTMMVNACQHFNWEYYLTKRLPNTLIDC